ncbi:MAG: tRNA 2-selenouridine(34) synthase MnmH [Chitinophagaceae bacterium]
MGVEKISVDSFVAHAKNFPIIDVRSEAEFEHAHIPGAWNLPLFNNDERKIVGTIYKQDSREQAIKKGLEFFGPKMKEMILFVEGKMNEANSSNKTILVHCWRGGMRSAGVAWLLDLYGFKVYTLVGGYKAYRNWVLKMLETKPSLKILGGYTGSGKTIVLDGLKKLNQVVIDLEGLAGHRGSAFGNIGLPKQPTQEMFENKLAGEIFIHTEGNKNPEIWLEDESQRIGTVNIPQSFWIHMRNSPVHFLDIPFERRLDYLVETYGKLPIEELKSATERIQKKLGGLETKTALGFLEEKNIKDAFSILLKYYDKLYHKGLEKREDPKPSIISYPSSKVDADANATLLIK